MIIIYYFSSQIKYIRILNKKYGDHNFIQIYKQTKLRIAPRRDELVVL